MEKNDITKKTNVHKHTVHHVLAHSYAAYFVLFLVGVTLDLIFKIRIFPNAVMVPAGFVVLVLATFLIFWAQHTSRVLDTDNLTKETFCKGPYCYTRSPTHWGLFFLMLGFGIIVNAIFVILTTLISFIVSRYVFLEKEEAMLEQKYGTPYKEYKKAVRP